MVRWFHALSLSWCVPCRVYAIWWCVFVAVRRLDEATSCWPLGVVGRLENFEVRVSSVFRKFRACEQTDFDKIVVMDLETVVLM